MNMVDLGVAVLEITLRFGGVRLLKVRVYGQVCACCR